MNGLLLEAHIDVSDPPFALPRGKEELDAPFAPVDLASAAAAFLHLADVAKDLKPSCESPIEVMLGSALIVAAADKYRIVPQFSLSRYRYDFAVMGEGHVPLVLVECDGAAFHCTDQQLANDRAKDEAAIAAGTRVVRVTGSQINANPESWASFILGECR